MFESDKFQKYRFKKRREVSNEVRDAFDKDFALHSAAILIEYKKDVADRIKQKSPPLVKNAPINPTMPELYHAIDWLTPATYAHYKVVKSAEEGKLKANLLVLTLDDELSPKLCICRIRGVDGIEIKYEIILNDTNKALAADIKACIVASKNNNTDKRVASVLQKIKEANDINETKTYDSSSQSFVINTKREPLARYNLLALNQRSAPAEDREFYQMIMGDKKKIASIAPYLEPSQILKYHLFYKEQRAQHLLTEKIREPRESWKKDFECVLKEKLYKESVASLEESLAKQAAPVATKELVRDIKKTIVKDVLTYTPEQKIRYIKELQALVTTPWYQGTAVTPDTDKKDLKSIKRLANGTVSYAKEKGSGVVPLAFDESGAPNYSVVKRFGSAMNTYNHDVKSKRQNMRYTLNFMWPQAL